MCTNLGTPPPRTLVRQTAQGALTVCVLVLMSGCTTHRGTVEKRLLPKATQPTYSDVRVDQAYRVGCMDTIEVRFMDESQWSTQASIGPSGRLLCDKLDQPRIEGKTPPEIAHQISQISHVDVNDIAIRVVEYRSHVVLLFGQIKGPPRSVAYRGPENRA